MTGRRYYMTTLAAWNRCAAHFVNSHWVLLSDPSAAPIDSAKILAIIEADEGVHLQLDDDSDFEALPSPLVDKPISQTVEAALAPHGVAAGSTAFQAAEVIGQVHPLLRHRVF